MSTILDALRRVQQEGEPRDLRESVTHAGPPRPPQRGGSRIPLFALLLFAALCATGWFVWPGQETLMAYLPFGENGKDVEGAAPTVAQAKSAAEAPTAAAAPTVKRSTPEERQAAQKERQQRAAQLRAKQQAAARQRQAASRASSEGTAVVQPARSQSARTVTTTPPPTANRNNTARSQPAARRQTAQRTSRPAPSETLPTATQTQHTKPVIDTSFSLEAMLPRRASAPQIETPSRVDGPPQLSEVSLESVRWHPDPGRREAKLLVDGTRTVKAREGDVIGGMLIHRIDPGLIAIHAGGDEIFISLLD